MISKKRLDKEWLIFLGCTVLALVFCICMTIGFGGPPNWKEFSLAALLFGVGLWLIVVLVRSVIWAIRTFRAKAIVLGGCLLFVLCGLFPPWLYTHSGHTVRSAGYRFLLTAPQPLNYSNSGIRLDVERLAIEWLCILAGTGMALMLVAKSGGAQGKAPEAADSDKHAATTPPPATETVEAATSQPTAKTELPSPPAVKTKLPLWIILTSLVSLAIIVVSLVVWLLPKPKPQSRSDKLPTWDETTPIDEPKPKPERFTEADFQEKAKMRFTVADFQSVPGQKPKQQSNGPPISFIPDTEVEIKGVGLIYFPGDMSAEQIRNVMRRKFGSVRYDEMKAKSRLGVYAH